MIYDISRPIGPQLSEWPGDEKFQLIRWAAIDDGALCNVGVLHMSLHFGTHIDAPYHFIDGEKRVHELSLEAYCGIAAVVDARGKSEITTELFDDIDLSAVPRILVKTGVWTDHGKFPTSYPVLADGVPDYFGNKGVKLLGLDLPSVDKFDGSGLPNHYSLAGNHVCILESLDLSGIEPGLYELIALPLRIVDGDGSPVRAVLRDLPVAIPAGSKRLGQ